MNDYSEFPGDKKRDEHARLSAIFNIPATCGCVFFICFCFELSGPLYIAKPRITKPKHFAAPAHVCTIKTTIKLKHMGTCMSTEPHLLARERRVILSNNLYQSSEIESGDMWPGLNYHHLLIISHDMEILWL